MKNTKVKIVIPTDEDHLDKVVNNAIEKIEKDGGEIASVQLAIRPTKVFDLYVMITYTTLRRGCIDM